ncbi:MAG TPA: OmpW family outer membrane protein [Thermoanaerobaculia bacterium]|nr:OmpW family outer membrane protein [Thermoanaerobaculia bacterium]
MRYVVAALFALSLSIPAFAQRAFDLTGNVVWVDPTGGGSFEDLSDPADIDFDATAGYGIAANVFFGDRISAEFAISRVKPETRVRRRVVGATTTADFEMIPMTAVLQFHFAPNAFIDPYIGGGAAYVLFDDVDNNGLGNLDRIDLEDDIGFAVNAGVGIKLGGRLGLVLDAKYVPLEANATAVTVTGADTEGRVDISPIIVSAGLSLRF